jgi:hypothetical protein
VKRSEVQQRFRELLVQRLVEVAPRGITVTGSAGAIEIRDSAHITEIDVDDLLSQPGDVREHMAATALAVLNRLQDVVSENQKNPWPAARGRLPLPNAKWSPQGLRLWYGSESEPALELLPLWLDLESL